MPNPDPGNTVLLTPPGPWLRLVALLASGATLLAVVSGAAHLGTAHRLLAALAVPPLLAVLVAAAGNRRLARASTLRARVANS